MADALAISGAVVQFLDVAVRLSIKLHWLCSELRDVPEKIRRLQSDLDQQIIVARDIQSSFSAVSNPATNASSAQASFNQILVDYVAKMSELLQMLESVTSENDVGLLQRSWTAFRAVHKRREILLRCEELAQKKESIVLWLGNINLKLSSAIKTRTEDIHSVVIQSLEVTRKLEEATANAAVANQILPIMAESSRGGIASHAQELGLVDQTHIDLVDIANEWHNLESSYLRFRSVLESNRGLARAIRQTGVDASQRGNPSSPSGIVSVCTALRDYHMDDQAGDLVSGVDCSSISSRCTCKAINQITHAEPLSMLHFRRVFQRQHYRDCPKSASSKRTLEYTMRIIPPRWFLSHSINLSLVLCRGGPAQAWSISPIVFGTSRIVDPNRSPAFQAVHKTSKALYSQGFRNSRSAIASLELTLKDLFQCQQASVLDEDCSGNTILYRIIQLYAWQIISDGSLLAGPAESAYLSLIRYILAVGANPNVLRSPGRVTWEDLIEDGGTGLDMLSDHFIQIERTAKITEDQIFMSLVDHGGEFSRPVNSLKRAHPYFWSERLQYEVELLRNVPEQIEFCGHGRLSIAIIQRSKKQLMYSLTESEIAYTSPVNGLKAVHFAVFWPWALQKLVDAGADVNVEDNIGRRPIHLAVGCRQQEAVEMLLRADCSLYTPEYSKSLLQLALTNACPSFNTAEVIVDALINRHTRLVNLALAMLPDNSPATQAIHPGILREDLVPLIHTELSACGYNIPPALELDLDGQGVYDTAALHANTRLTMPLADRLWSGGFHRIDDYAPSNGLTPLLQSWYGANFEMVTWFLDKGASILKKHRDAPISGLHLYATRLASSHHDYKGTGSHGVTDVEAAEAAATSARHIAQLNQDSGSWVDGCSCYCSVSGCTPLSTLIKAIRMNYGTSFNYAIARPYLQIWHDKMLYVPEKEPDHGAQLLRAFVFETLDIRHTCCGIGQEGQFYPNLPYWRDWKGLRDAAEMRAIFKDRMELCQKRMLECKCALLEKPLCAAFCQDCVSKRNSCGVSDEEVS